MIESCTKRRMILTITLLGGLTLLVLIYESRWASNKNWSSGNKNNSDNCWLHEEYSISEDCHPCSDFEIKSGSQICSGTHFKEVVQCKQSGKVTRSCDKVIWLEERNFWLFETCMLASSIIFSVYAYGRQKILDHRMLRRVQKQLANSV